MRSSLNHSLIPDPTGLATILSIAGYQGVKSVGKAANKFGDLKTKNLEEVRDELDRLLKKQNRKILIVIDDIDRLSSIEIRQTFQLVKMLGDFPNTVYLLAFDRGVVVKALEKVQEGPGIEYLEKIVQIPFELPAISKQEVDALLFKELCSIGDIPEEKWDKKYCEEVHNVGIRYFFANIRDVNRYINSLRFALSLVKDEVYPIDFFAITALQVFEPAVYAGIQNNKDVFSGVFRDAYGGKDAETAQARARCDEIIDRAVVLSKEQLKEFLKCIFPKLESIYSNMRYGSDRLASWRRAGRVCSPDVFDTFFRLAIPKGELSKKEIKTIIGLAADENVFAESLMKLKEEGRIVRFLDLYTDYTREEILQEHIPAIVRVLMNIGDLFFEGKQGMLETDTPMRIQRIFYQLSQRYEDQAQRFELFRNAIVDATNSIYTIVYQVDLQGQQHGKWISKQEQPYPEEKRTVNAAQLDELEELACEKIRKWANSGRLIGHPNLISILYRWQSWCPNGNEVRSQLVHDLIATDNGMTQFLYLFVKSYCNEKDYYAGRDNWKINLESVSNFISVDELTPKVRTLLNSGEFQSLPAESQRALQTFIDTVDGKVKEW